MPPKPLDSSALSGTTQPFTSQYGDSVSRSCLNEAVTVSDSILNAPRKGRLQSACVASMASTSSRWRRREGRATLKGVRAGVHCQGVERHERADDDREQNSHAQRWVHEPHSRAIRSHAEQRCRRLCNRSQIIMLSSEQSAGRRQRLKRRSSSVVAVFVRPYGPARRTESHELQGD